MVEPLYKYKSGMLLSVEMLTVMVLILLTFDVEIVTCSSITSRKFNENISESQKPVLAAAIQGDEAADRSPYVQSADDSSSIVSEKHQPTSCAGSLTSTSNQNSASSLKHSDITPIWPYFFQKKATISHTVTHELKKHSSEEKRIKEDIPSSRTTFFAARKKETGKKHSRFESGSRDMSEKVSKLPPIDREISDVNISFHREMRPFTHVVNDSQNISFPNSTAVTNATAINESLSVPTLHEENNTYLNINYIHNNLLFSKKLITNFTSSVENGSNHPLANKTSNVKELLKPAQNEVKLLKSSASTLKKSNLQREHSSSSNVDSEMNNDAIMDVSTNGMDLNSVRNPSIREAVTSLALAASEGDEKLVSTVIDTNVTRNEASNSVVGIEVRMENVMHPDTNTNVSTTTEIFSAVRTTEFEELSSGTVYSEARESEPRFENIGTTDDKVDDANGVVNNGSDITVLSFQVEKPIKYENPDVEVNGSWIDKDGGNNLEDTRKNDDEVGKVIDFISGTNVTLISMSNPKHQVSEHNETWKLRLATDAVNFEGMGIDKTGGTAAPERIIGSSQKSVEEQHIGGLFPGIRRRKKDNLRALKSRDVAISKTYKINASESILKTGQNGSNFVKHLNSDKIKHRNFQHINSMYNGIDFTSNGTNNVENLPLDFNFSQPEIIKPVVDFGYLIGPSGNNKTLYVQNSTSEGDSGKSINDSDDTKFHQIAGFELTEDIMQEVYTLNSKQFSNHVNSVDDDNIQYLNSRSENVTFDTNPFTNFVTSRTNRSFTTDHDIYQNASMTGNNILAEVPQYYNASDVSYGFVSVPSTNELLTQHSVERNTSRNYEDSFSTPESNDAEIWNTGLPVLSSQGSHHRDSTNNRTEASPSDVTAIFLRNDSASDNVLSWPVKLAAEVSGDLILGGLMMVHEREDTNTCGPIMPQGGIQALEAMLYTLDELNSDPQMIPNVTIGAHILDDCDKDTYGLEMAVDFIKGRELENFKLQDFYLLL
jgi:hypothetical protein